MTSHLLTAQEIFGDSEAALTRAAEAERIRRAARRLVEAEERGPITVPALVSLAERLTRPRRAVTFRIEGWLPLQARVIYAAQFKAGKTTTTGNVIRSLVDGAPFLGRDRVVPVVGSVALVDLEMSEAQLEEWLAALDITGAARVFPVPLRGQVSAFDILREDVRAAWAARLRAEQTEVLILDPLRPVLDALGLDEHRDAGRFLVAFDALLREADIQEAIVVHHMGHVGERSRGDSRLRDWPDVEWRLMRETDDPASPRFITAYGRDVDQPEQRLEFDRSTRRLTLAGGSRHDQKTEAALDAVVAALTEAPAPLNGKAIKARMADSDIPRDTIDAALKLGRKRGTLTTESGPHNSTLYRPVSERPGVSGQFPPDGVAVSEFPGPYKGPETRTLDDRQQGKLLTPNAPFCFDGDPTGTPDTDGSNDELF